MVLTADPIATLIAILIGAWSLNGSAGKPSLTQIGQSFFVAHPGKKKFTQRAITVEREPRGFKPKEMSIGSAPPIQVWDHFLITAWTLDDAELWNMMMEIVRIMHLNKVPSAGAGITQLDILPSGGPKHNLSERDTILAEDVRVRAWYEIV